MEPIFARCNEAVWYLAWGGRENALKCMPEGVEILDYSVSEGAGEKHLPDITKEGDVIHVRVGSVEHPMSEEHSIQWIFLETKRGGQLVRLSPTDRPVADFVTSPADPPVAVYAYCNLHGFWKKEV